MLAHTSVGLRLSSTRPLMISGRFDSTRVSHSCSNSEAMAPRARQSCRRSVLRGSEKLHLENYPLDKVDDVIHGGVAGDPLVQVSDNVHTDVTQEVLGLLCLVTGHQGGEEEQGGGELHHHDGGLVLVGSVVKYWTLITCTQTFFICVR